MARSNTDLFVLWTTCLMLVMLYFGFITTLVTRSQPNVNVQLADPEMEPPFKDIFYKSSKEDNSILFDWTTKDFIIFPSSGIIPFELEGNRLLVEALLYDISLSHTGLPCCSESCFQLSYEPCFVFPDSFLLDFNDRKNLGCWIDAELLVIVTDDHVKKSFVRNKPDAFNF